MPSKNGHSECAVRQLKQMTELNPPSGNQQLQELVQAINAHVSGVRGAGPAYQLLLGRIPLLELPTLPSKLSVKQKEEMQRRMADHRKKFHTNGKNTNKDPYDLGERVLIFDPKGKSFNQQGTVISCDPPPLDGFWARSYQRKPD